MRKAIDRFVLDDDDSKHSLSRYKLTEREWEICELIVTILLPFKKASTLLQSASRPAIDEVFWTYESLFNKIDMLKETFLLPEYEDKCWVEVLHDAVNKMAAKLRKHYDKTAKPFVYPNSVILEPRGKLILFKQQTWDKHYADTYSELCRQHYITHYELVSPSAPTTELASKKRKLAEIEIEHNDYRSALNKYAASGIMLNEYDRYLNTPASANDTLESWKQLELTLPTLTRMAQDTFAVPATGAGVERQFSKSSRIATWARNQMGLKTLCEMMKANDYLSREGDAFIPRKKQRRWLTDQERSIADDDDNFADMESDSEENKIQILQWEKEWWQKVDAKIVS